MRSATLASQTVLTAVQSMLPHRCLLADLHSHRLSTYDSRPAASSIHTDYTYLICIVRGFVLELTFGGVLLQVPADSKDWQVDGWASSRGPCQSEGQAGGLPGAPAPHQGPAQPRPARPALGEDQSEYALCRLKTCIVMSFRALANKQACAKGSYTTKTCVTCWLAC